LPIGCLGSTVCNFDVTFKPTSLGVRNAFLGLEFFEENEEGVFDRARAFIPLTGLGVEGTATTPLPAALPLFAGGLGAIGLLARRRKQKREA
jgi:hypothetical protein